MGRGKVELKWIEDKTSRHVSFSKRRNGLMKKAHELSVLCDVDVALFVFSGSNRLYEFSTANSMVKILARYQDYKHADETFRRTSREIHTLSSRGAWTYDELKQTIQWKLEEHKIQQSNISELSHLETDLHSALKQVRNRKTEMMMGSVAALREKHKKLRMDKRLLLEEIKAARLAESNVDG